MGRIRPSSAVLTAALAVAFSGSAAAGSTGCMFENGAIVVPAALDEAGGDWLLDVASPTTQLHETRAQMEGVEGEGTRGALRFAGERIDDLPTPVVNLDARAPGFVTPIVGVIGEDVLRRYVVDIRFAPCRIDVYRPGHAPPLRGERLAVTVIDGRPTVHAAVARDGGAIAGPFVIDTASKAAVRLRATPAGPDDRGDPRQAAPAAVRALSLSGRLYENPSAARGVELPDGVVGAIGVELLSRFRLRLDGPGGRLILAAP